MSPGMRRGAPKPYWSSALWCIAALCFACRQNNAVDLGPRVPSTLTQTQAHLVIEQALNGAGDIVHRDQAAELQGIGQHTVDFVMWRASCGVEWLTRADREADPKAAWPRAEPGTPLQVVEGKTEDGRALQVLVLDEQAYLYESNPRWVQRGAPSIDNAEERLRADVQDFLGYVQGRDPPLAPVESGESDTTSGP